MEFLGTIILGAFLLIAVLAMMMILTLYDMLDTVLWISVFITLSYCVGYIFLG